MPKATPTADDRDALDRLENEGGRPDPGYADPPPFDDAQSAHDDPLLLLAAELSRIHAALSEYVSVYVDLARLAARSAFRRVAGLLGVFLIAVGFLLSAGVMILIGLAKALAYLCGSEAAGYLLAGITGVGAVVLGAWLVNRFAQQRALRAAIQRHEHEHGPV